MLLQSILQFVPSHADLLLHAAHCVELLASIATTVKQLLAHRFNGSMAMFTEMLDPGG